MTMFETIITALAGLGLVAFRTVSAISSYDDLRRCGAAEPISDTINSALSDIDRVLSHVEAITNAAIPQLQAMVAPQPQPQTAVFQPRPIENNGGYNMYSNNVLDNYYGMSDSRRGNAYYSNQGMANYSNYPSYNGYSQSMSYPQTTPSYDAWGMTNNNNYAYNNTGSGYGSNYGYQNQYPYYGSCNYPSQYVSSSTANSSSWGVQPNSWANPQSSNYWADSSYGTTSNQWYNGTSTSSVPSYDANALYAQYGYLLNHPDQYSLNHDFNGSAFQQYDYGYKPEAFGSSLNQAYNISGINYNNKPYIPGEFAALNNGGPIPQYQMPQNGWSFGNYIKSTDMNPSYDQNNPWIKNPSSAWEDGPWAGESMQTLFPQYFGTNANQAPNTDYNYNASSNQGYYSMLQDLNRKREFVNDVNRRQGTNYSVNDNLWLNPADGKYYPQEAKAIFENNLVEKDRLEYARLKGALIPDEKPWHRNQSYTMSNGSQSAYQPIQNMAPFDMATAEAMKFNKLNLNDGLKMVNSDPSRAIIGSVNPSAPQPQPMVQSQPTPNPQELANSIPPAFTQATPPTTEKPVTKPDNSGVSLDAILGVV